MRIRLRDFSKGLVVTPQPDKIPDNALFYGRGIDRLTRGGAVNQRAGSTALHTATSGSIGITGIYHWDDVWWYGSSNSLYQGSTCISSGTLDGNRIHFLSAAPTAGVSDYLFVCGAATDTIWKIDSAASKTVTSWGINPPVDTAACTTGGVTGELTTGADYRYRFTYYNSETGTRSNPTLLPTTVGIDTYTKLLVAFDGDDAATTGTDQSYRAHTLTFTSGAELDTAQKKFGSASLLCATTDDYVSVADHIDWTFGTGSFTIDFWFRVDDLTKTQGFFAHYQDLNNYYGCVLDADKYIRFEQTINSSANITVSANSSGVVTTGSWHHVAVIRGWGDQPDRVAVVIDGTTIAAQTVVGLNVPNLSGAFLVGQGYYSTTEYTPNPNLWIDEFRVSKGIARWTESFTPSTTAYSVPFQNTGADDKAIAITNIPPSTDTQVTHTEIWRTQGDGSAFFLATRIESTQTSFTDTIADIDLGTDELPTDNLKPYYWFDDAAYHNASMFWLTRTQAGEKGRVYYSPIGRSEAVQGFINVSEDSEPLKKLVKYGTGLGVFSEAGFYEILGDNPYYSRQVPGVPGTVQPESVTVTPYGVFYIAQDGPRLLTGTQAVPLGKDTVDAIFQGEARGLLSAWSCGTWATYGRDEVILTNSSNGQALAVDLRSGRWRDLGLALHCIHYSVETDEFVGNYNGTTRTYLFEKAGQYDDNATAIPFRLETKHFSVPSQQEVLVRNVFVDYETTQSLTFGLQHDYASTTDISGTTGTTRRVMELPYNVWTRDFGLRITGGASTGDIKIYGIDFDVYIPEEEKG